MNIKIIVDSASDIEPAEAEAMGVEFIPMEITFGAETYRDGLDLSHREFFEKLIESSEIPKTSQITEYAFDEKLKEVLSVCDGALIITMSSKLSGTYFQAVRAAEKYGDRVRVVDSNNVAVGEYLLVEYACRLLSEGASLDALKTRLDEKKRRRKTVGSLGYAQVSA